MSRAVLIDEQIAALVSGRRSSMGIVKADMARHLGMSRQSYQLLEDGRTAFTVATLVKIAKKLKVDPRVLIPEE